MTKPTRGAVIAAQIICGVDVENTIFRQPTEYGGKTCLGIANLIDDRNCAKDMLATLRAIANDCEDYLNDDLEMDAGELCQAFLAAINKVHDQATGSTFLSENPVDEYGEKV